MVLNLKGRSGQGWSIGAALFLLLCIIAAAALAIASQNSAQRWVRHTLEVETRVQQVLINLAAAESNQRSYLLTGEPQYRDRFEQYKTALAPAQRDVTLLTRDNPAQAREAARLVRLCDERLQLALKVLMLRDQTHSNDAPGIRSNVALGTAVMDRVREKASAMLREEDRLLDQRTAAQRRAALFSDALMVALALGVVMIGWLVLSTHARQVRALETSRTELLLANEKMRAEADARALAEDNLRQAQKMESLGQLTGGIAHDFNNMLAVIIGALELAAKQLDKNMERSRSYIGSAMDAADRAAQLTARLLAFSRRQPLQPQVLDPNRFVADMSEMLRRTLGEYIRIETVLAGGLWRIRADPAQLEHAILNLAINARDAMPTGGKLTIETANTALDDEYARTRPDVNAGQYVCISLTDTGSGMPADVLEHIFEPFFTTKSAGQGTGLGLSQVFGFVKQSQGHVAAYSEPGMGAAFKIYLPRETTDAPDQAAAAPAGRAAPAAREQEVLCVVEDDATVRHVVVDYLRELGYTVVSAPGAMQALALLDSQPRVDLLFTDVVMPEVNGRELAEEVRRRRPETRVLFTSGYTQNAIVHNGMLDTGIQLISKPYRQADLARKIREVLDA